MLTSTSLGFLKQLLDTPGPSGFEAAPARVWREQARTFRSSSRPEGPYRDASTARDDARPTPGVPR